jgi:hypothetical protein
LLGYVYLAERFGKWPWEILGEPADDVGRFLRVLSVEAQTEADLAGVGPEDDFFG